MTLERKTHPPAAERTAQRTMKVSRKSEPTSASRVLRIAGFAVLLAVLPGCMTTPTHLNSKADNSGSSSSRDPLEPPSEYWVLVKEDPITFYPKGLPTDAETDPGHGEWVKAGQHEARFFIPRGGVENRSEHQLMVEAFSIRSASEKREIEKQNRAVERRRAESQKPSFADRLGYGLVRHHVLYGQGYSQQSDQAWLDRH